MNAQSVDRQPDMPEPTQAASEMGLASSAYLSTRGEEECYRAKRYGRTLALMVVGPGQADRLDEFVGV